MSLGAQPGNRCTERHLKYVLYDVTNVNTTALFLARKRCALKQRGGVRRRGGYNTNQDELQLYNVAFCLFNMWTVSGVKGRTLAVFVLI